MVLIDSGKCFAAGVSLRAAVLIPQYREGIIDPILPDKNAMLQPFTTPGLGFTINERLLRKYESIFKLTETGLKIKVIREKGLKAVLALKKRKEQ